MEELKALLEKYLNENLELITLSAPRKGREELKARMLPADLLFSSKPAVTVSAAQAARFLNGGGLSLERTGIKKDGWIPGSGYRVYSPDRVFLGLGAVNLEKMELSVLKLFPQGNEGAGV